MTPEAINELRARLGLTQKELATRLKVDTLTVSRWERGVQTPTLRAITKMQRLINNTING